MSGRGKVKVALIAGGVGGAKLAEGFASCADVDLTVVGNVADDDEFHGLWVSPDIDTMLYTLSGRIDRSRGWGVEDDATRALEVLSTLGHDTWMTLGDRDLGLHIYRSAALNSGRGRQQVTDDIARAFKVPARIALATEDVVQTRVRTAKGWLSFQEYFVREQCRPDILELAYHGLEDARANPVAIGALEQADLIVIAPSNPLLSVAPILGIAGFREVLERTRIPRIAVSPLIGGRALKGPADRMLESLGLRPNCTSIAQNYAGLIDTLLIDTQDAREAERIARFGIDAQTGDILMSDLADKKRVARRVLSLALLERALGVEQ